MKLVITSDVQKEVDLMEIAVEVLEHVHKRETIREEMGRKKLRLRKNIVVENIGRSFKTVHRDFYGTSFWIITESDYSHRTSPERV